MCGCLPVQAINFTDALKIAKEYTHLLLVGMMITIYECVNGEETSVADVKKIK